MAGQWSLESGRTQIRKRLEALAEPTPQRDVIPVNYDKHISMSQPAAKALIAVVAGIALIVLLWRFVLPGGEEAGDIHTTDSSQNAPMTHVPGASPGSTTAEGEHAADTAKAGDTGKDRQDAGTTAIPVGQGSTSGQGASRGDGDQPSTEVVVSIQGLVPAPGLLRLSSDTRVGEAIDRAGGVRPPGRLESINLAERVVDGMQIMVDDRGSALSYPGNKGTPLAASAPGNTGGTGVSAAGKEGTPGGGTKPKVNINTADSTILQTLDGVGPATAEAIVNWRASNGPFTTLEQLLDVRGIGPAKFAAVKDNITL